MTILKNIFQFKKQKAKIISIIRRTPGGRHAWCESSAGIIRKPMESIPIELRKCSPHARG